MAVTNTLTVFADGVWLDTAPVSFLGLQLTATMAVLRLNNGALLLYSPLALTPERRQAIEALGRVAHLYAPNLFHHLRLGEWAAAFPSARVHGPEGLESKRPDLKLHRLHATEPEADFAGVLEELPIQGFRLRETALFYPSAKTLLVADLVHNIGRPSHGWTKIYTQTFGFYDRVALSRVIRWTAFDDRAAARRSVDRVLAQPFERLVVGHGAPLTSQARDALTRAYAWLPG